MARTAVTPVAITLNSSGVNVASGTVSTALDPTNGHIIATNGIHRKYLIHVKNTTGSGKTVTFKAGVQPPAFLNGQGDLVSASIAATTGEAMFIIDSARFAQADGSIWMDVAAAATGSVAVYALPQGA